MKRRKLGISWWDVIWMGGVLLIIICFWLYTVFQPTIAALIIVHGCR